jgi:hypothetical protein
VIDASGVGLSAEIGLAEFADFTRGKDRKGDQGLGRLFGLAAPRGLCGVTVDNDTATAVSPWTAPSFLEGVTSGKVGAHDITETASR